MSPASVATDVSSRPTRLSAPYTVPATENARGASPVGALNMAGDASECDVVGFRVGRELRD